MTLRAAAFVAILTLTNAAPFATQVLGVGETGWRMFHLRGGGQCAARYERVTPRGREPIDAARALGFDTRADAPEDLRRPPTVGVARRYGRALCRDGARRGATPDVRMHVRCATSEGLHTEASGEENLCLH